MNLVKSGIVGAIGAGLVGCSTPDPINYSGLAASVDSYEQDAFSQCIAESHRSAAQIDIAQAHLAALRAGSDSTSDLEMGENAVRAAVAHRAKALEGCDGYLLPLVESVALLDARVTKLETVREIVRGVTFPTGSSQLTTQARTVLDVVANRLERAPRQVEVGGHASSTGRADANMKLSQARADSVKAYLIKRGVDASLLSARGYGITRPIADNSTKAGQRANQRIELTYGN